MRKNIFKIITKYITFVFVWNILLFPIAIILLKTKGYLLKDIFKLSISPNLGAISLIVIGIFSIISIFIN